MIDRVNAAISGAATRSAIFLRASERPSPMRISPRASSNSSISGPSMCSVSLATAPSKPMPASTLTASRSSASGRSAETCDWRRRPLVETKKLGAMNPPTPKTITARKPVEEGDREGEEEGDAAEHVGRHPAHRGQPADLPSELLPLADGVRDHVEEARERTADLALDRHGRDRELEVLRAGALGHHLERLVHRPSQ